MRYVLRLGIAAIYLSLIVVASFALGQAGGAAQRQENDSRLQTEQRGVPRADSADETKVAAVTAEAQSHLDSLNSAIGVLNGLIARTPPSGLAGRELTAWNEHTIWLKGVRDRYSTFADRLSKGIASIGLGVVGAVIPGGNVLNSALSSSLGGATGGNFGDSAGTSGQERLGEMTQMNMEFLALQNAVQTESRRFQTLSNASKARHDAAMNSIRNMK